MMSVKFLFEGPPAFVGELTRTRRRRRIFGRMRHLVEELEDDTPVPVQKPPTALACFIASPFTTMSPF